MAEGSATGERLSVRAWRRIALVWLLVAIAWSPALWLTSGLGEGLSSWALALASNLIHFAPWALAVPWFIGLSRRFPIGLGQTPRHGAFFVLIGIGLIPLFTAISVLLARSMLVATAQMAPALAFDGLERPILISSLFAIPTYVAVVAIGQTIAYVERFRQRERLLTDARAEALRAQIAPHFLFNALNAISSLGYSDPARADAAMVRLAGLLRETLERPQWTTLREEVALAADTIELHRLLLGDRLAFDLHIAPEAWDCPLPSMLLQPIVENALAHGLSRRTEGGTLALAAAADGDGLRIEIVNDVGEAAAGSKGTGLGLANVRARLAAAFGEGGRLEFELGADKARATLSLPRLAAMPS